MATSRLLVLSALIFSATPLLSATPLFAATPRGVVYEFTASWCGPCQQMSPMVSRLERQGYPIKKIDVDQYREFAGKYRITSIPAFVLVIDGKEEQRIIGATSEQDLKRMLARIPREQPQTKPETLLASNRTSAAASNSRKGAAPRRQKPRFQIPFLGRSDDEPADISEATIRANIDDVDEEPALPSLATPMEASVRVRASSGQETNYGSGTIISSGDGRTLVLTCGHICRGMMNSGTMEVDVFYGGTTKTYLGKVLRYYEKADVGLLEIPTDETYPHSPVVPAGYKVKQGDAVASVGCGGGDDPTLEQHRVTALNPYLGPDHIICTGEPIEGRSGGGLFNTQGEVVGVCFARDEVDHRGLYAGVMPIHQLLKQCRLEHLYRAPQKNSTTETNEPLLVNETVELEQQSESPQGGPEKDEFYTEAELDEAIAADESSVEEHLSSETDIDALKEAIAKVGEAEVVCVVRPIKNPRAASRVVILNRASDQFVRYLTDELESDALYNTTSLKIPSNLSPAAKKKSAIRTLQPKHRSRSQTQEKTGPRRYRRTRR